MGNQESEAGKIRRLIETLRAITLSVQIVPFIFASFYILDFAFYSTMSESLQQVCDTLFYISPIVIIAHLAYSRLLHLCKWHRMACVLPLFPQLVSFIDYYIIALTEIEAYVTNIITIVMSVLLLVSAYKVFFANGRK
jgi:hypothetical protein